MPYARKSVVQPGEPGVYHCISRCVRRASICGFDFLTKRNFEHRRLWIYERVQELPNIFAIEVFACAVMSNHYHLVIRVNPDEADCWSDEEVVWRWDKIYSVSKAITGVKGELDEATMNKALGNPELVAEWRSRLCSISWFMKQINEPLARSANKEDGCKGRFWEGRFKCQHLADEGAVLACMAYVDLNPIRAGVAQTPEESDFTSVQARIIESQSNFTNEDSKQLQTKSEKTGRSDWQRSEWLTPLESIRVGSDSQGWQLKLEEYLTLIDETGRCMQEGKKGVIPTYLAPILTRMKLEENNWLMATEHFGNRFYRVCGQVNRMMSEAKKLGQRWFQGMGFSRAVFQK